MRSDRDIKRTPKRPLAGTPAGAPGDAGKPDGPAAAPERKAVPSTAALQPGKAGTVTTRAPAAPDRRPRDAEAPRSSGPRSANGPAGRPPAARSQAGYPPRPPSGPRSAAAGGAPPSRRREEPLASTQAPRPPRPARPQEPDRAPARPPARAPSKAAAPAHPLHEKRWFGPDTPPRDAQEGVRLSKVLSDRGLASRREADDWIDAGWVKVDGEMAVLGQRVKPDQQIEVDPVAHMEQAKRVTILINKPIGFVSGQAEDGYEPASVLVTAANHWEEDPARKSFHAGHARHLAPAGRLDIDSTGLLVLTQDGRVAKHLIGENSEVEKEYLVRVEPLREGSFDEESGMRLLQHGLVLDEKQLRPARVSWANEDQLRFVLREGRKRQIRRMCELVGLNVTGLRRVRIGSVVLGKLPVGQWRYLRDDERF